GLGLHCMQEHVHNTAHKINESSLITALIQSEKYQNTTIHQKVRDQLKSYDFGKQETEELWRQKENEIENEKMKVENEINEMCQSAVPWDQANLQQLRNY
uniref:Uncharacterized protein n=1 Tax=Amphimedon queenslandica TaxID=400682 RepID=A0A1X7T8R7_AMPQE